MNKFTLVVSSPDGNVFQGEITFMKARGAEGEFAVMAGHTPFITNILPCEIKIHVDGEEKFATVGGGLLTVDTKSVTLLTGSFKWKE